MIAMIENFALQAVGIIGMVAYFSYLVADYMGLSGIVALFCCAVTMSHYALHNISKCACATETPLIGALRCMQKLISGTLCCCLRKLQSHY